MVAGILLLRLRRILRQRLRHPRDSGHPRKSRQEQRHDQKPAQDFLCRRTHDPELSGHRSRSSFIRSSRGRTDSGSVFGMSVRSSVRRRSQRRRLRKIGCGRQLMKKILNESIN